MVAANPDTPAIARASALTELHSRVSPANIESARTGLVDPDPMVRIAALDMLEGIAGNRIWPFVSPLLSDSSRGVRIRAAALLADVPAANQPAADRASFERAAAEFVASEIFTLVVGSFPMPRPNIKLACGSVRSTHPQRSI
jgi:hypothetical protein